MNERIKLLAEQCHHRYSEHNIDLEKFAELIVRECAGFRNELGVALCTDPSALHRYFGVEE